MARNSLISLAAVLAAAPSPAAAQDLHWMRQLGSPYGDAGGGVAVDGAGNAYITGYTFGNLGGPTAGNQDVFLVKYDASGAQLWQRQFGTTGNERGYGVAADGAGNAYVTGTTEGDLGGTAKGAKDAFLAKYDSSGVQLWVRQLGALDEVHAYGVAVDGAGNAYIAGSTLDSLGGPSVGNHDIFLAKYDTSGALLWVRQLGTATIDRAYGVAADSAGNAYIAGTTMGGLGGPNAGQSDVFLAKYDGSGAQLWIRQLGTSGENTCHGVAVDGAGNTYIAGHTLGSFGGPLAGSYDLFLIKHDPAGALLWMRQVGTGSVDYCDGLAADSAGNAYLTGTTLGSFGGGSGQYDAFLIKYDASGGLLWMRQFGSATNDRGFGVAADGAGNAFVTGSLGGPTVGNADAFLAKYGPPLCYANCDGSTGTPRLTANDFNCFSHKFVTGHSYANCDGSTAMPTLTPNDFQCFLNSYAAGCS